MAAGRLFISQTSGTQSQGVAMTVMTNVQHAAACLGERLDQNVRDVPEENIRVSTWRCLDCGAFTSENEPLTAGSLPPAPDDPDPNA